MKLSLTVRGSPTMGIVASLSTMKPSISRFSGERPTKTLKRLAEPLTWPAVASSANSTG